MTSRAREQRGIRIVLAGGVKTNGQSKFTVQSESNVDQSYEVNWKRNHWECNCPDYKKHSTKCKHIYATIYHISLRQISKETTPRYPDSTCPHCGSEENVVRRGRRYNKTRSTQTYYCEKCKLRFSERTAFFKLKTETYAVTLALDLYYKGLSLRKITDHLKQFYNIQVHYTTVFKWIKKYIELIGGYLKDIPVGASERWRADETVIRVGGRKLTLWGLLDDKTRVLLAQRVSEKRNTKEARELIRAGLRKAEELPSEVITDGFSAYDDALSKEVKCSEPAKNPHHREVIHLKGPFISPLNNNKMERFIGTVKDRLKFARGLKSEESAKTFAEGFSIYHNMVKPHRALNGLTPMAEATNKQMVDGDRWLELIRKASLKKVKRDQ